MADALVPNDALGGGGSLNGSLKEIAVNGLSRAIDGYFSKKYPLASTNDRATVNAQGQTVSAAAPQPTTSSAASSVAAFFTNPVTVAVGIAAGLAIVVALVLRR